MSEHDWDYYSVNKPQYIEVWRQNGATPQPTPDKPGASDTNAIAQFKADDNKFTAYNTFKEERYISNFPNGREACIRNVDFIDWKQTKAV